MFFPEGFFLEAGNLMKLDAHKTPTDLTDEGFTALVYIPQITLEPALAEALSREIQEYTGYDEEVSDLYLGAPDLRSLIQNSLQEDDTVSVEEWQKLWLMISESAERGADAFKITVITDEPEEDIFDSPDDIPALFTKLAIVQAPKHKDDTVIFAATAGDIEDGTAGMLTYVVTTTDSMAVHPNNMSVWMVSKNLMLKKVDQDIVPFIASLLVESHGVAQQPASISDLIDAMKAR